MAANDDNQEVYHNLTESSRKDNQTNDKWTLYLMLCCLTACVGSLIFGYNIGVTNLPTPLIKEFFAQKYFPEYYQKLNANRQPIETQEKLNHYMQELSSITSQRHSSVGNKTAMEELNERSHKLEEEAQKFLNESAKITVKVIESYQKRLSESHPDLAKIKNETNTESEDIQKYTTFLWTITTSLFVVGGMIGAFTSKYVVDFFGRKKGILFHHIFTLIGAVLAFIAPIINRPECVLVSRFVFGVQGGMTCGLIPTYLSEISPAALRGATGVMNQLGITIGILISQTLGFRQLLGTRDCWNILLALPIIPGAIGVVCLLLFFPESPRALLINNRDEESARKALHRLRNTTEVSVEIDEIKQESRETKSDEAISLKDLFTLKELRWPLITGLILQLAQQLCGINAIFFYSEGIFRDAAIQNEHIQYAVFATGFINVIMTLVCIPLIDRLGRKPLLVYPMIIIILDFLLLTVFLYYQTPENIIFSYLSIVCIIVFIMCFAVGLGPIPFLYVAECFRQDARSAALAICMFTNWVANLCLTLTFPYLAKLLTTYVFLVFVVVVAIAVFVIFLKVPETKNRSVDEIMAHFAGKKQPLATSAEDEASGKLMPNTKV